MDYSRLDLGDYFLEANGKYLEEICEKYLPSKCKVLEIGSWKGRSSSIIGKVVKDKGGILYCIDTWKGSEGEEEMVSIASKDDILRIFRNNMQILGIEDYVIPIVADSASIKDLFKENYFDLLFIDGNHRYSFAIKDMNNYLPKLKPGGIVCGDDCEEYGTNLPIDIVDKNKDKDWTRIGKKGYHCGVIYALYETFNDKYELGKGSTFWWKVYNPKVDGPKMQTINLVFAKTDFSKFDKESLLLPLDIHAVKKVNETNSKFVFLEDFIGEAKLSELKLNAFDYFKNAYKNIIPDIVYLGISLMELDREYLRWFWFQAIVTLELLEKSGTGELSYSIEQKKFEPSAYYYENSITEYVISGEKEDSSPERYIRKEDKRDNNYKVLKDKRVFVLHPGEFERFQDIIRNLSDCYKDNFCIILLNRNNAVLQKIKENFNIETVCFNEGLAEADLTIFDKAILELNTIETEGRLGEILTVFGKQFEHLFLNRYPRLYQMMASWNEILSNNMPKAIIGSRLADAESQIPLIIGAQLGCNVYSIPHGINLFAPINIYKTSINILSSHYEELLTFHKYGWDSDYIHYVEGLELEHEYLPKFRSYAENRANQKSVLVLVNPCGWDNIIWRNISIPNQIFAIQEITDFAIKNPDIKIRFKTHPFLPNQELFELARDEAPSLLLPIGSSLIDLLPEFDLVVSLNYSDAAVLHSANALKPIIFCFSDSYYYETQKDYYEVYKLFGELVFTTGEMLEKVKNYFSDSEYREILTKKTTDYITNRDSKYTKKSLFNVFYPETRNVETIISDFIELGVKIEESSINLAEFKNFLIEFPEILKKYSKSGDVKIEKCLEHFISWKYLELKKGETYIDIASASSNFCDALIQRGINAYRLDLSFPKGIIGNQIGADAGDTKLPANFANGMSLQCAFECFQGDSDINFIKEAERILVDNGKVIIAPLYVDNGFYNITSKACDQSKIQFDKDAVKIWRRDRYEAPFSRNYSPKAFYERIIKNTSSKNISKIIYFNNIDDLNKEYPGQRIYCNFVFYFEKQPDSSIVFNSNTGINRESRANNSVEYSFSPVSPINMENSQRNGSTSSLPKVSIIIPTRNRALSVKLILDSLLSQVLDKDDFEIIVVDNGSTDNTKEICDSFKGRHKYFTYIYEPIPGLLSGRHAGAKVAKAEILTFIDDDIEVTEGWLNSILKVFENPNVHLAGGPTLPIFEGEYPEWILFYFYKFNVKFGTGYLSLKDKGAYNDFVDPTEIWGLNYSIRKSTLYKCGGFNPDNISKEYQYFQGDGETGLANKLKEQGLGAFYSAETKVFHNVYKNRMTVDYFKERLFYQGVCDSYTQLRKKRDINLIEFPKAFRKKIPPHLTKYEEKYRELHKYYLYGFFYHQYAVKKSDIVYQWVLRDDYFDYKLPEVPADFHKLMDTIRKNLGVFDSIISQFIA